MIEQLKPCPCCGQCAVPMAYQRELTCSYGVRCIGCGLETMHYYITPAEAANAWNMRTRIETRVFDEEETHENCTVQILRNSVTGEQSIGWWENDAPPTCIGRNYE